MVLSTRSKSRLRAWAAALRAEITAIVRASRDPRTPRVARWLALAVAAYAMSPIDLIPDAVPVLGLVDDLIILPLGVALVLSLIPREVLAEHRQSAAAEADVDLRAAGIAIVVVGWLLLLAALAAIAHRWFH